MGNIVAVYTIPGCRAGLPVTKIVTVFDTSCELEEYSDGGVALGWTEGSCSGALTTEFDKSTWCEIIAGVLTGVKVQIITTYSVLGVPTNTYYNLLTGAVRPGNPQTELAQCPDVDLESDAEEFCDNNTTAFFRRYVKQNGVPTGVTFDTSITGAAYVPVGPVSIGSCQTNTVARARLGDQLLNVDAVAQFTVPVGTGHVERQARDGNVYVRIGAVPTPTMSYKIDEGEYNEISDPQEIIDTQFLGETLGTTIFVTYWSSPDSVF